MRPRKQPKEPLTSTVLVGVDTQQPADPNLINFLAEQLEHGKGDLPKLPKTHAQALKLAQQAEFSVSEAVHLAEQDPSLASRFLSTANSAMFSRGIPIENLDQAAVRLGISGVRDILYVAVYAQMVFDVPRFRQLIQESFQHSVVVARLARRIAALGDLDVDQAYLAGLLHDVGKAVCFQALAGHPEMCADHEGVLKAVDALHASAGAAVIEPWDLPADVVNAVAFHHDPSSALLDRCISMADGAVHAVNDPDRITREDLEDRADALDLRADQIKYVLDHARQDLEDAA